MKTLSIVWVRIMLVEDVSEELFFTNKTYSKTCPKVDSFDPTIGLPDDQQDNITQQMGLVQLHLVRCRHISLETVLLIKTNVYPSLEVSLIIFQQMKLEIRGTLLFCNG